MKPGELHEDEAGLSGAVMNDTHRFHLWRMFSPHAKRLALFVMLNPSTADAFTDDPTIKRCIGFAKRWNCDGLHVVNLFAYRTPKPKVLVEAHRHGGPVVGVSGDVTLDNDSWLVLAPHFVGVELVVLAWGAVPRCLRWRVQPAINKLLTRGQLNLLCLGRTKHGDPRHPLYLRNETPLEKFPIPVDYR